MACLPGHALTTLHYIIFKYAGRDQANGVVDWLLAHLEIVPQGRKEFVRARSLGLEDFEDAARAGAAEAFGYELIITRDLADFFGSPVPAVTPEEFLLDRWPVHNDSRHAEGVATCDRSKGQDQGSSAQSSKP